MASAYVLKFQLGDRGRDILVYTTPKDGKQLDLDLLATDGDAAYKGKGKLR